MIWSPLLLIYDHIKDSYLANYVQHKVKYCHLNTDKYNSGQVQHEVKYTGKYSTRQVQQNI